MLTHIKRNFQCDNRRPCVNEMWQLAIVTGADKADFS